MVEKNFPQGSSSMNSFQIHPSLRTHRYTASDIKKRVHFFPKPIKLNLILLYRRRYS